MGKYEIIRVFTSSSLEEILEEGGSGWWKINEAHASKCKYIICIQNNNGPRKSIGKKGTYAPQNTGFIIGEISKIIKDDKSGRKLICFNKYAEIDINDMKLENRNPVSYISSTEINFDIDTLEFKDIPKNSFKPLTIEEAKEGLALKYNLDISRITIEIKF
jgi:hypothetical protein